MAKMMEANGLAGNGVPNLVLGEGTLKLDGVAIADDRWSGVEDDFRWRLA